MLTEQEKAAGLREVDPPEPKPEWRYRCPKCKARIGEPCVYLQTAQQWHTIVETGRDGRKWRRDVQRILHRAGEQTTRSHNERLVLRHRQSRPRPTPVVGPSAGVRALWAADRIEYFQMRNWLHANAYLFKGER